MSDVFEAARFVGTPHRITGISEDVASGGYSISCKTTINGVDKTTTLYLDSIIGLQVGAELTLVLEVTV